CMSTTHFAGAASVCDVDPADAPASGVRAVRVASDDSRTTRVLDASDGPAKNVLPATATPSEIATAIPNARKRFSGSEDRTMGIASPELNATGLPGAAQADRSISGD